MSNQLQCAADMKKVHARPWPTIEVEEDSPYTGIRGGVLDGYDRAGHKEIERRVALIHRNYPINKQRVLLVGDENGQQDFLHNIYGNRSGRLKGIVECPVVDILQSGEERKNVYGSVFASEKLTKQLIDEMELSQVAGSPITTVVSCWQDGHDKYLKMAADALPGVDFLNICYGDPTGQGRSFARRFGTGDARELFETQSTFENEPDLPWVIKNVMHVGESTWFAALPKQMKTWVMMCVVKALLTGEPLFGDPRFTTSSSKRVIYLIPEAGRGPVRKRLKMLGLMQFLYDPITNPDGRLFVRTLSAGEKVKLTDPALIELAKGADIFIDTAVRYLEGDENKSGDVKVLTENILNLLSIGARSVQVAHHAAKGFENASTMTLQNMFRGSGEFGAALTNAYGLCQTDEKTSTLHFHPIVGRDLDELIPDMILQGRPHLSETGNFKVVDANAENFKGKAGAPESSLKQQKIEFARTLEGSLQQKADAVNEKFDSQHTKSTIYEWLKPFDADKGAQ